MLKLILFFVIFSISCNKQEDNLVLLKKNYPIIYRFTQFYDTLKYSDDMLYNYDKYLSALEFVFYNDTIVHIKSLEGEYVSKYKFILNSSVIIGDTTNELYFKFNYFGQSKSRLIMFSRLPDKNFEQNNLTQLYTLVTDTIISVNHLINEALFAGVYLRDNGIDSVYFLPSGKITGDFEFTGYSLAYGEYMEGGIPLVELTDKNGKKDTYEFQRFDKDFTIGTNNGYFVRVHR